jgi:hypothetical protein
VLNDVVVDHMLDGVADTFLGSMPGNGQHGPGHLRHTTVGVHTTDIYSDRRGHAAEGKLR